MPSSRPSPRAAGASEERLSSYPPPAPSQPGLDEEGGFPASPPITGHHSGSHVPFSSAVPNKPWHASPQLPAFRTGGSREAGSWGQAERVPNVPRPPLGRGTCSLSLGLGAPAPNFKQLLLLL